MLDTIVSLLKESGVYAWEISDVKTTGWEFYFIRHALDQNRVRKVEHITVKVYQLLSDGAWLGSASGEIAPTASAEEARALIEGLAYRATLVKNKPYTLHKPHPAEAAETKPIDAAAIARDFVETMRDLPETAGEDINSYEIFVAEKRRHFLNSEGIDLEESYPDSMIEVVVNARRDGHEIELYRMFPSGTCDAAGLRRDVLRTMRYGKDRLAARPTPALGKADVLFTGRDSVSLYEFFADRLGAAMVYRKMSDWKLGEPIAADFRGDRPGLTALRELPNSSKNRRYDAEGAPIRDTVLLDAGVAKNYLGGRMFSSYLGLNEAFLPTNFAVSGGSAEEAELRQGPYLEVVDFSDFQVDSMTGDLFGEIRLAYWHDGDTVRPVSGGSLSGSMLELMEDMRFTGASVQYNNWRVPAATRLKGVTVSGIE